jgi:hypothetical protein
MRNLAMKSIAEARDLETASVVAMAESRVARDRYLEAMTRGARDDELRSLHYDVLAAASKSDYATARYMGVRQVEYAI